MGIKYLNIFALFFCVISSCNGVHHRQKAKDAELHVLGQREFILSSTVESLYRVKSYLQAIKCLDTLIKIDSTNGKYYFMRGSCYGQEYRQSEFRPEIENYSMAIKLNYDKPKVYYDLGLCYAGENDSLAIEYFRKSLEADPNYYFSTIQIAAAEDRLNFLRQMEAKKKVSR
jgi:tetratricopeptide (TPR) repeat protein